MKRLNMAKIITITFMFKPLINVYSQQKLQSGSHFTTIIQSIIPIFA